MRKGDRGSLCCLILFFVLIILFVVDSLECFGCCFDDMVRGVSESGGGCVFCSLFFLAG